MMQDSLCRHLEDQHHRLYTPQHPWGHPRYEVRKPRYDIGLRWKVLGCTLDLELFLPVVVREYIL
jgi:hypothetical protein